MNPEELKMLAQKAILEKQVETSPFFRLSPPVVQIWSEKELPADFPIPSIYVGQRFCRREGRSGYIYNLCAYQILRNFERYKQEFDL